MSSSERVVQIRYHGGDWVAVRSALRFAGTHGKQVRQQGYNLTEDRWSVTKTPLSEDDKSMGLFLMGQLKAKVEASR